MILKVKKSKINKFGKTKIKIVLSFFFLIIFIKPKIQVMYFISKNIGDNLNYFFLKKIISRNIIFVNTRENSNIKSENERKISKLNEIAKTDFLFIGSIMGIISNWSYIFENNKIKSKSIISNWFFKIYDYFHPLIIFGSGFISNITKKESYIRNIKIISVRGNITLQRLIQNGVKVTKKVILADPGILIPIIFHINETNMAQKIYDLCIIPHYKDKHNKIIYDKIKINKTFILDINENPYNFIISLSKCKRVLSSSLHGLIFSDSLGIPNMRMILSNKIIGGDYKFKDYYSAYGLNLSKKYDLRNETISLNQLKEIDSNYLISRDIVIKKQCQLLINFPYKLKREFTYFINLCKKSILL